jgi:serine/threonine protein kinase
MDIEGYKIHRKIGEGAMAGVFLADQVSLGRQVALKVLAPALAAQKGFRERFLKEGRIIAYLKHPQIVNVYDLGSHHHHYFLSMEFLSGGTLEQKIKTGLSTAQSVQLIKKIGQSLSYAHDNGVIHRDIKSQNIMFRNDDTPVLTDFGIARLMDNDPQLTTPGRTIGSPLYMSPEQICGRKIDARADLYSVGILFYKMLTNTMPYQSDHILTVAMMHKTAPIPVLSKELSLFQPVLNRLLAKDPDQRYSSAQEFIEALNQLESERAYLRLGSDRDNPYTQPKDPMPVAGKVDISWGGQLNQTDSATEVVLASQSMDADIEAATLDQSDARNRTDEKSQALNDDLTRRTKGKAMGKMGLGIGAALSVLVAGIFVSNYYATSSSVLPKPSAVFQLKTTKANVQFHGQIPDTSPAMPMVRPQNDHPVQSLEKTTHNQPVVDQKKISELMAKAQRQLEKYNLTSPAGDNCYDTYQQLLSLDPSGQKAKSILIKIGNAYHDLAAAAKAKGNLHQSLAHIGKGLAIQPKDSSLLAMQDDLRAKLAEQDRMMRERTMRIEQEKMKRAAELASMQKKLEDERQAEPLRVQEAERDQLNTSEVEPEIAEPQKVKTEIEPSESTGKSSDTGKRLFGTF